MNVGIADVLLIVEAGAEVVAAAQRAQAAGRAVSPEEMAAVFAAVRRRMDAADARFDAAVENRSGERQGEAGEGG